MAIAAEELSRDEEREDARAAPSPRGVTTEEVARLYRVSPDKVRGWIKRGELAAINTARSRCGKPRYVVTPAALEAFERGRAAAAETPKPKRRRLPKGIIDFYPD